MLGNKSCAQNWRTKQQKQIQNFEFQNFFFFPIDQIFVCMESFDSFHLDKKCESYGQSCFLGNLNIL